MELDDEDYELLGLRVTWESQVQHIRETYQTRLDYWRKASKERYQTVKHSPEFKRKSQANARRYYQRMKDDPTYKKKRAVRDAARYAARKQRER